MGKLFWFFGMVLIATLSYCQVGIGTTTPSPASMLEVSSTSDNGATYHGFMPPRVPDVAARDEIPVTAEDDGLIIYIKNPGCLQIWNGISWENIHCNNSGALARDLFISEYVEGSGNNKVIEIANFTGSPVNLDNYRLLISRNGGTNESTIPFNLGFILENEEVYVIKHSGASGSITANQTVNNLTFNGDDAIVLIYPDGEHIDILGRIGDTTKYGENVTLRKKSTLGPSITYIPSDYIVLGIDNFSGLGYHIYY